MTQAIEILNDLSRRRRDLGMSQKDLAGRCGVSVSTIKRILAGEAAVSFSNVSAIAETLGMRLAGRSGQSIASMRERQARAKARSLVAMVQGTSALEAQALAPADIELMEQRTAAELLSGPSHRLWGR